MPPMVMVSVVLRLLMTRSPRLLSEAVTAALPTRSLLSAFIRPPTVSLPVDAYVVVLLPALTVMMPPARTPSVDRDVLSVTGAVPVAAAAVGPELLGLEDAVGVLAGEGEVSDVPPDFSTFCIAADNWVLTRFRAVWLAMLAKPLPKLASAELMAPITELVAALMLSFARACCQ